MFDIDAAGGVTYDPAVVRGDNEMKVFLHRNAINPRQQRKAAYMQNAYNSAIVTHSTVRPN